MAGGWARDDAVNEQIEVSTAEAIARVRHATPKLPRPNIVPNAKTPSPRRVAARFRVFSCVLHASPVGTGLARR